MPEKKKPIEDEFGDVIRSLSSETQDLFRAGPAPSPTPTPTPAPPSPAYRAPGPRYGGTPTPSPTPTDDQAPANLREADTELRRQGYTKGSREGDRVLKMFWMKKKE